MVLAILIVFGLSLVCAIIGGIIGIIGEVKNGNTSHVSSYPSDSDDNHWMGVRPWFGRLFRKGQSVIQRPLRQSLGEQLRLEG